MNLQLAEKIDKLKEMSIEELSEKFNCSPEEICEGDYIARYTNDTICPYKVILGFANFEGSEVADLGKLEIVYGKKLEDENGILKDVNGVPVYLGINLAYSSVRNLGNLKKVYGSINLNKKITSLKDVEFLGSSLFLGNTNLVDLGNLQLIDGMLNLENNHLNSLGVLKKVRALHIGSQLVRDFGNIQEARKIIVSPTNYSTIKLISKEFTIEDNKYIRSHNSIKNQGV